ncbi:MAG: hypothetical protein ACRBFS_05420 [Aureispira sp.]
MKGKINQRLTLSAFKDKYNSTDNSFRLYTNQVLAYGLEQHMGSSSETPNAASRITIRGNT